MGLGLGEDTGFRRTAGMSFKEYPPRQRAASFTIDQAIEKMKKGIGE